MRMRWLRLSRLEEARDARLIRRKRLHFVHKQSDPAQMPLALLDGRGKRVHHELNQRLL